MKLLIKLTFLTILSLLVFACCEPTENDPVNINNKINADFGDCIGDDLLAVEGTAETTIEWTFSNGIFAIKHFNAGFNCCFDRIEIDLAVHEKFITIHETDINPNCYCLCVRDIDYNISEIPTGSYTVRILTPYLPMNDDPIYFQVELKKGGAGSVSFERTAYPWVI